MSKKNLYKEAFNLLCGKHLGEGDARSVFVNNLDESTVVKISKNTNKVNVQNMYEMDTWQWVKDPEAPKGLIDWFAPVEWMSPRGDIIIQRRTTPANINDYPEEIPALFSDNSYDNFGILDGKFVCHDYGFNRMPETGYELIMVKPEWKGYNGKETK